MNNLKTNWVEVIYWYHYDHVIVDNNNIQNCYHAFSTPIGMDRKGYNDTSMQQMQHLPDPHWFNVTSLSCTIWGEDEDILEFCKSYSFELIIGQKVYLTLPMITFPTKGKLTDLHTSTLDVTEPLNQEDLHLLINKLGSGVIVLPDKFKLPILQGQRFKVEFRSFERKPKLKGNIDVYVGLWGELSREVQ